MDVSNRVTSKILNRKSAGFLAAAVLLAAAQSARPSGIVNGGFESGDLTGWTLSVPTGNSPYFGVMPAGSAGVVGSWGPLQGMSSAIAPATGNDFAFAGTDAEAHFITAQSYDITMSQTLTLSAGDTISGQSSFYNGDYEPQDSGFVNILNGGGTQVATPWSATSGDPSAVGEYEYATPWTSWSWVAPSSGTYTLQLGASTQGDDILASYAFFDNIAVTPGGFNVTEVPEPSILGLFGLGATGFIGFRRWLKK